MAIYGQVERDLQRVQGDTIKGQKLVNRWREKIRVSMIINHLQNHLLGRIQLSKSQLRAAEILLRKRLPDLAMVDFTGQLEVNHVARVPQPVGDIDEWRRQFAPKAANETTPAPQPKQLAQK